MASSYSAAVAALLVTAASASAAQTPPQGPDTVHRLPAIAVVTSVLPAAGASPGSAISGRATTLDAAALHRFTPRTGADALAGQAGASLYDDLGSAFKPTLVMRGFTASGVVGLPQGVSVFIDGVPVNEPDAGQVNFDLLPLGHAQRVEIFHGTASLLGPNSLAGAINIVTNRGGGPTRADFETAVGTHGRRSVAAATEGRARGWSYYTGAGLAREAGWRQLTSASTGNLFANIGRFGDSRGAGLQVSTARSYAETAGSLPLSVYVARPDSNLSSGDFEDLRQLHVAAAGYVTAGGGRVSLTAFLRAHDAERFNVNQVSDPDVRGFSANRSVGAQAAWTRTFAVGAAAAAVHAGAGGSMHRTGIRLYGERIDPGLTTDVESPIRKADAYVHANYARGPVTLTGGARFDVVHIPFHNLLRPERDTTSTYRHLSPRGGLTIALGRGIDVFASAARSFRAPAVIELACADPEEPCPLPFALGDDPPLDPVIATTAEAGVRWNAGRFGLDGAVYRTHVRNDIFLFPYEDESEPAGSTIDGFFANLPLTRREGLELHARLRLGGTHDLHASYGATRATFQSTAEIFSIREAVGEENIVAPGDRMPLVPDQTFAIGGAFRVHRAVMAGAEARHVGPRWLRGDEANDTAPLPSHTMLDVHADWEHRGWTVGAVVTNLLDRRYAAFGTFNINQGAGDALERFLTPGSRRAVQVRVRRLIGG